MDITKIKVSGSITVEAVFVVGIILLIILYQTGFTFSMYGKVKDFGEDCIKKLLDTDSNFSNMRLTRFALNWVGKD